MRPMTRTAIIAGAAFASLAALAMIARRREQDQVAFRYVRPAGPDAMRDEPEDWDIVDEQSDGSFPASDPPGNY